MKEIVAYEVRVWDGGDRHDFSHYLSTEVAAEEYKVKHKYDVVREVVLRIFDSNQEFESFKNGEIRKKALAKLSPIERAALGF